MTSSLDKSQRDRRKRSAALLSVCSNTLLVGLKLVVGLLTGSVAILSEAVHSGIDLIASFIAFYSLRKASEPADERHLYGHDKIENVAAAIEGILMLAGAAVIVIEAIRHLIAGREIESVGIGIAAIAVSIVINLIVSTFIDSPVLEGDAAHLRSDALSSIAVFVGLILVQITGESSLDAIVALGMAALIAFFGVRLLWKSSRVLLDEALPDDEVERVRLIVVAHAADGVAGFHELRSRRAGSRRYLDMHLQFVSDTSLERAHAVAHEIEREIEAMLGDVDVLIHIEPEASLRPGSALPQVNRG